MTGTTTQQELVELERRYWQALTDGDINAALELTDDPCLVTGAQGLGLIDHQTFSAMMQQASWTIDRAEIADDVQVRMLGSRHGRGRLHGARGADRRRRPGQLRRRGHLDLGAPRRPLGLRGAHRVAARRPVRARPENVEGIGGASRVRSIPRERAPVQPDRDRRRRHLHRRRDRRRGRRGSRSPRCPRRRSGSSAGSCTRWPSCWSAAARRRATSGTSRTARRSPPTRSSSGGWRGRRWSPTAASVTCWPSAPRCGQRCTTCGRRSRSRSCRASCASRSAAGWTRRAPRSSRSTSGRCAAAAAAVREADVEAVAVMLLFSFLNPAHELRVGELLAEELPGVELSLSCQVVPEFREYVRASTTALNAALLPLMGAYLTAPRRRGRRRRHRGAAAPDADQRRRGAGGPRPRAADRAVGLRPGRGRDRRRPAGRAGRRGRRADLRHGRHDRRHRAGARRRARRCGSPARRPGCRSTCRRSTCSASAPGGGSIARVDEFGSLTVGPASAGADPGPAAYGRGGTEATVTDAHVVLGTLSSEHSLAGGVPLDRELARAAVMSSVGEPLGLRGRGGRRGDPPHRQRQHGQRPAADDGRPRARPAPIRAGGDRRRRADARLRAGRRGRASPASSCPATRAWPPRSACWPPTSATTCAAAGCGRWPTSRPRSWTPSSSELEAEGRRAAGHLGRGHRRGRARPRAGHALPRPGLQPDGALRRAAGVGRDDRRRGRPVRGRAPAALRLHARA